MSVHIKHKCKHGVIVKQCRCPGGIWVVVPCPPTCRENAIETALASSEEYVPKHMKKEERRCGCGDIARYPNGCGPSGCMNRPA
jgi:predicted metal-dependent hydrolase